MASTYGTYTADLYAITFKTNTYNQNFYTGGKSLIELQGAPRVFFNGETFTSNGDMCKEALDTYGTLSYFDEYTIATGATSTKASNLLGRSLIGVYRS